MTTQQLISTGILLSAIAYVAAIVWSTIKARRAHVFTMLHVESQKKMLDLQSAIDGRHVMIIKLDPGDQVSAENWNEMAAEIAQKTLAVDMSIADLRRQLTKL